MKQTMITILGPTASGKTSLAAALASKINSLDAASWGGTTQGAEIISADSRQVYRGMDIGTGKDLEDYTVDGKLIPYHLIDICEPGTKYDLFEYQQDFYDAYLDIRKRGVLPILCGGTGLYINSVADGYNMRHEKPDLELRKKLDAKSIDELIEIIRCHNPGALDRIDLKNKQRLERAAEKALSGDTQIRPNIPRYDTLILGVTWPRDVLYERIRERLDIRLSQGMIEEVENLRKNGAEDDFLYRLGLEYRYILMYLRGEFTDFYAFYNKLFMEIRHLAKEQMTWFRKRKDIIWIDMTNKPEEEATKYINEFLDMSIH